MSNQHIEVIITPPVAPRLFRSSTRRPRPRLQPGSQRSTCEGGALVYAHGLSGAVADATPHAAHGSRCAAQQIGCPALRQAHVR